MEKRPRISLKTKLLIIEYKERYPSLSPNDVAELFSIEYSPVLNLFIDGEIIVPSKINKQ
jgi:hypothetical protein